MSKSNNVHVSSKCVWFKSNGHFRPRQATEVGADFRNYNYEGFSQNSVSKASVVKSSRAKSLLHRDYSSQSQIPSLQMCFYNFVYRKEPLTVSSFQNDDGLQIVQKHNQ